MESIFNSTFPFVTLEEDIITLQGCNEIYDESHSKMNLNNNNDNNNTNSNDIYTMCGNTKDVLTCLPSHENEENACISFVDAHLDRQQRCKNNTSQLSLLIQQEQNQQQQHQQQHHNKQQQHLNQVFPQHHDNQHNQLNLLQQQQQQLPLQQLYPDYVKLSRGRASLLSSSSTVDELQWMPSSSSLSSPLSSPSSSSPPLSATTDNRHVSSIDVDTYDLDLDNSVDNLNDDVFIDSVCSTFGEHNSKETNNVSERSHLDDILKNNITNKQHQTTGCCTVSNNSNSDSIIKDKSDRVFIDNPDNAVMVDNCQDISPSPSSQYMGCLGEMSYIDDNGNNILKDQHDLSESHTQTEQHLLSAARESIQCGSLTPMLKVELKYLIQARRMSEGKGEMEVCFSPREECQLSSSEVEKVERRRKQNRQAAKRFREKRKSNEDHLLKNIADLQDTNSQLARQAEQLRKDKQLLMEVVAEHLLVCPSMGSLPMELRDL